MFERGLRALKEPSATLCPELPDFCDFLVFVWWMSREKKCVDDSPFYAGFTTILEDGHRHSVVEIFGFVALPNFITNA